MFDALLTDVYLTRHGETTWNVERRSQGRSDSPLTQRGRIAVDSNVPKLVDLPIDLIVASPLGRAVTTAAVYGRALSLEVSTVDELAEIDQGLWTGLTDVEIAARFPGEADRRAADLYEWRYPGGESYEDVDSRAAEALFRISELGGQRPLVVSHAGIGRMLLRNLLDLPVYQALKCPQPHCLVRHVDLRELRFTDLE